MRAGIHIGPHIVTRPKQDDGVAVQFKAMCIAVGHMVQVANRDAFDRSARV